MKRLDILPLYKILQYYKTKYHLKCTKGDLEITASRIIKAIIDEWSNGGRNGKRTEYEDNCIGN